MQQSSILVRIPYLEFEGGKNNQLSALEITKDSWSLDEYSKNFYDNKDPIGDTEKVDLVHQASFLALDSCMCASNPPVSERLNIVTKLEIRIAAIIVSRPQESTISHPIIFPEQDRLGSFHCFVQLIGETLRISDRNLEYRLESAQRIYVRVHLRIRHIRSPR